MKWCALQGVFRDTPVPKQLKRAEHRALQLKPLEDASNDIHQRLRSWTHALLFETKRHLQSTLQRYVENSGGQMRPDSHDLLAFDGGRRHVDPWRE